MNRRSRLARPAHGSSRASACLPSPACVTRPVAAGTSPPLPPRHPPPPRRRPLDRRVDVAVPRSGGGGGQAADSSPSRLPSSRHPLPVTPLPARPVAATVIPLGPPHRVGRGGGSGGVPTPHYRQTRPTDGTPAADGRSPRAPPRGHPLRRPPPQPPSPPSPLTGRPSSPGRPRQAPPSENSKRTATARPSAHTRPRGAPSSARGGAV